VDLTLDLDPEYFNAFLRRDLIHNAFIYYRRSEYKTTNTSLTVGTTAGSGVKPAPQKGRGKARVGNKRANFRKGGGTAHGLKARDFSF